jgi:hypothetical protein
VIGLADSLWSHDRLVDNQHLNMKTYLEYSEAIVARPANSGAELKTKLIPRGTFAGTIYQLGFVQNGQAVPSDTAEQGGGQN